MDPDPHGLDRFVRAQDPVMPEVMAQLRAGAKVTHWMWFVFPQLRALGRSATAQRYGIASSDEARAYAAHPVLGPRLRACCEALLQLQGSSALQVFGSIDEMKLRSCFTLFDAIAPQDVYALCLERYFGGVRDGLTQELLARA